MQRHEFTKFGGSQGIQGGDETTVTDVPVVSILPQTSNGRQVNSLLTELELCSEDKLELSSFEDENELEI